MTPQDIREKTFEKAMFGGYDMAAVQNYQEEVATELANAQKEIAVLKGKMKVLVDKIEEYRASEDAMRLAILSAQKVGKQIEDAAFDPATPSRYSSCVRHRLRTSSRNFAQEVFALRSLASSLAVSC